MTGEERREIPWLPFLLKISNWYMPLVPYPPIHSLSLHKSKKESNEKLTEWKREESSVRQKQTKCHRGRKLLLGATVDKAGSQIRATSWKSHYSPNFTPCNPTCLPVCQIAPFPGCAAHCLLNRPAGGRVSPPADSGSKELKNSLSPCPILSPTWPTLFLNNAHLCMCFPHLLNQLYLFVHSNCVCT